MRNILLASAAALAIATPALAQDMSAEMFVAEAANGGLFEVESSQLAVERAENAPIVDFANQMIEDHTAANEQLTTIAESEGITVPTEVTGQLGDTLAAIDEAQDDRFEGLYLEGQTTAHRDSIELFQSYAENGDNPQLVTFAQETLPVLEMHATMLQDIIGADATVTGTVSGDAEAAEPMTAQ